MRKKTYYPTEKAKQISAAEDAVSWLTLEVPGDQSFECPNWRVHMAMQWCWGPRVHQINNFFANFLAEVKHLWATQVEPGGRRDTYNPSFSPVQPQGVPFPTAEVECS